MRVGWERVGGEWYFTNGTAAPKVGWVQVGNDWYYLHPSGFAARNEWVGDGNAFYVGENGAWIPNYPKDPSAQ